VNLYIDLKSARNRLLVGSGNDWAGLPSGKNEVAIFFDGKVSEPQLSQTDLI